jgi:hypothetical protein
MRANVFMKAADGSGEATHLLPRDRSQYAGSVSPDGRFLTIMEAAHTTTDYDLILLPMYGDGQPRPLVRMLLRQYGGRISPDGRWMAYVSDESGRFEVYVTAFPSGQGRCQISTEGGGEVVWARSGRELYWRRDDNTMMAAEIDAGTGCSETRPKALFAGYLPGLPGLPGYDSTRDGRFLMLKGASADPTPTELKVVLNWFEELRNKSRADQVTTSK